MTRKVVICVDLSEGSEHALQFAINSVLSDGDTAELLYVFDTVALEDFELQTLGELAAANAELEKRATETLEQIGRDHEAQLKAKGVETYITLLKGPPKHTLVDYVEEQKPDMVVMGSRGMGVAKRLLIGSTSDHCIHHIQCCPVVVTK